MPKRQSLGARIAQARRELGVREQRDVSQLDLAQAIGVAAATLSRWEADLAMPRDEAFVKLAQELGVDPGYLRYGVSPAKVQPGPTVPSPEERAEWMNHEKKAAKRASVEPEATKAAGGAKRRRRPR